MNEDNPVESPAVQTSSYDLIRRRLLSQGEVLKERAETLNTRRQEFFGSTQLTAIGQDRIRTENNCIPVDIVSVGGKFLFGYNVFIGLRKQTSVEDVFSLHSFSRDENEGIILDPVPQDATHFLSDARFLQDFQDLYTYYKDANLLQLRRVDGKLLAIFQVGSSLTDVRVLRWSVSPTGEVNYIDNSGVRDHTLVPSHDFVWKIAGREDHVGGRHPHVNICDKVFVEAVGGDLTIKIEDNTEDGLGIYREPVDDPNQALGDADIHYADLGNLVLIKIRPYREEKTRYFVFNTVTQSVVRIDAIGQSCIQLPEDHGIIFPGGYVLADGEHRGFDADITGMRFAESIRSPNGEDVLFVFYRPKDGRYILLAYNLIRKEVQNPIHCHGYSLFSDGALIVFRASGAEPTRVHPLQIWQSPFVSDEHAAAQPSDGSFLSRVGNADLVRGISEALTVVRMVNNQQPTMGVYESLIQAVQRTRDGYFWIDDPETEGLGDVFKDIAKTAELIIDEFVKVTELKAKASKALVDVEAQQESILRDVRFDDWKELQRFIDGLGQLHALRGRLITMQEVRYIDAARLSELEAEVVEKFDHLSKATAGFLLADDSLSPYKKSIEDLVSEVQKVKDTVEAKNLRARLDKIGEGLSLLTDVVAGLQIEDPTARTRILEGISEVLSLQNRARALLDGRRKSLLEAEGQAEFGIQFQLFGQTVQSAVSVSDSPEKCEEMLTRLMIQMEELESRFSEFEPFLVQLAEQRETVYEVFENRKQSLLEERRRRAHNTVQAAERIMAGIGRRTARMQDIDTLNAYFAADPMVLKVRELVANLRELQDPVAADDVQTQLRTARDEAIRSLRDRLDLFEGGDDVIRLGEHRFSVNTHDVELTMVPRDGTMMLHVTGTEFFEPVEDQEFQSTRAFWNQTLVSESPEIYRAEYLAATVLFDAESGASELGLQGLHQACLQEQGLAPVIRKAIEARYDEGYERGVHDADAALILEKVLGMYLTSGLLRFSPRARALATLFWSLRGKSSFQTTWGRRAQSFGRLRKTLEHHGPLRELGEVFAAELETFGLELGLLQEDSSQISLEAGHYLAEELVEVTPHFVFSDDASTLRAAFLEHLNRENTLNDFRADVEKLKDEASARFGLVESWIEGFVGKNPQLSGLLRSAPEVVALMIIEETLSVQFSSTRVDVVIPNILGQHPRILEQKLSIRLDEFLARLRSFVDVQVPAYREYRRRMHELLITERRRLRLAELKPQVLSTFVRNRLIDEVYLPLIGNNLAKQLGALGDGGRSDRSGLLLLISPPGYGKTTLMEYIAQRLGLVFVKVNGPSLGHSVTSLDPAEAPNATARQEVEKINLALEMGNNVLLYLDDIQHTDSELLQKFISLCDATRRIEGVWKGRTRTYDMRGKRFAVVMAGNPYNEAGQRFRIPDMLANRADTYNLGDILNGREDVFALSYLENALTSNPVLAPLATRDRADLQRFIRMAQGESIALTEMDHDYSSVEAGEIIAVFQRLLVVQNVLLMVNQAYIASASQDDDYRTEPPFQLQGSYRNMARLAERVVAAMNDEELQALIDDHYVGESQTLTKGAEQNLLKLAEMRGRMSEEAASRWVTMKREFMRRNMMGGAEDPISRVAAPLSSLVQKLDDMHEALKGERLAAEVGALREALVAALAEVSKPPESTVYMRLPLKDE